MADIKDKEYSMLKENLENMGNGAQKHEGDPVPGIDPPPPPLPPNIRKKRYDEAENAVTEWWNKSKSLETEMKKAYDAYQAELKKALALYNADVRLLKGLYGIYSETLRDYGIAPEKKRLGGKPRKKKE